MATFNINRQVRDAHYRYKMPAISVKIDPIPKRRHRLITSITNLNRIAKALGYGTTPEAVLKFLSYDVGSSCRVSSEIRKGKGELVKYELFGSYHPEVLQPRLDLFIQHWILCRGCDNPETTLFADSSSTKKAKTVTIKQRCYACGQLNDLVAGDKFAQYLKMKLPSMESETPEKYKPKGNQTDASADDYSKNHDDEDHDVEGWNEGDAFVLPTDDFAAINRTIELSRISTADSFQLANIQHYPERSKINAFIQYAKKLKTLDDDLAVKELTFLVRTFKLKSKIIKPFFLQVLKWTSTGKKMTFAQLIEGINAYEDHFEVLCLYDTIACERELLVQYAQIISNNRKHLLPYSAHVLHALYTNDIVDGSVILEWASTATSPFSRRMKAKCVKLLDWLSNADTESSSDSERTEAVQPKTLIWKKPASSKCETQFIDDKSLSSSDESEIDISMI
jgi:translation initiation factor 5